jgi:hypothetical protein
VHDKDTIDGTCQLLPAQHPIASIFQPKDEWKPFKLFSMNVCCNRRGAIFAGAVACGFAVSSQQQSQALPRGSIDARVAASFNTALAAGGDPVVCISIGFVLVTRFYLLNAVPACLSERHGIDAQSSI